MSSVRQIQSQYRIPWAQNGRVGSLVGLRSGVRLHVGILGAEQFLGPLPSQVLDDVGVLATPVITPARIPFGVFVSEYAARGFQHRLGGEVLARDQLQMHMLALGLVPDSVGNLGIYFGQWAR